MHQPHQREQAIPEVPGLPYFGNNLAIRRYGLLNFLQRIYREYGDIVLFRMESTPFIFLNSPAYADVVLVEQPDNFEKPTLLRASLGLLNNGLLTSKNAPNKQHRKLIAPAFTPRHIAAYAGIIADYAEQIPLRWAKDGTIEAEREMLHLILQILGKTLFDVELGDERQDFSKALAAVQRWIDDRRNARLKPPLSWPISSNKRFFEARAQLDAAIYHMIQERRQSGQERSDMLSMLVHARDEQGNAMPDVQVRDEVVTMILAGQETLASAIAWAWYLLTKHPEIYAQVQREAAQALAGRAVTFTDLPKLPYALQVFKEALRLYPPSFIISRYALEPIQLGDYRLPDHVRMWFSPYVMHRHPDYFADPERFDPNRFAPEAEARLPRHAYIPFGGGPRTCIGNHLALMIGQVILATLAQGVRFDLVPGQRVEPDAGILLRPKNGIKLIVRPFA